MQEDIRSVMREGRHLLSNLEAAKAAKADGQEDKDIKQDWDTVQRCSTLLKKDGSDNCVSSHAVGVCSSIYLMLSLRELPWDGVLEELSF